MDKHNTKTILIRPWRYVHDVIQPPPPPPSQGGGQGEGRGEGRGQGEGNPQDGQGQSQQGQPQQGQPKNAQQVGSPPPKPKEVEHKFVKEEDIKKEKNEPTRTDKNGAGNSNPDMDEKQVDEKASSGTSGRPITPKAEENAGKQKESAQEKVETSGEQVPAKSEEKKAKAKAVAVENLDEKIKQLEAIDTAEQVVTILKVEKKDIKNLKIGNSDKFFNQNTVMTFTTNESDKGRNRTSLASAVDICISKIANYAVGYPIPGHNELDPVQLAVRRYTHRSFDACRIDRQKSQVLLLLDNSGSCSRMASFYLNIAKSAISRGDVIAYWAPNAIISHKIILDERGVLVNVPLEPEVAQRCEEDTWANGLRYGRQNRIIFFGDTDGIDAIIKNSEAVNPKNFYYYACQQPGFNADILRNSRGELGRFWAGLYEEYYEKYISRKEYANPEMQRKGIILATQMLAIHRCNKIFRGSLFATENELDFKLAVKAMR